MAEFTEMFNKLKFSGSWRDYQKRVLDNLSLHLSDKKLHIVAAPGAGKTTLGIEVIARINKPTLILAPTITIRNQWRQRIIDAFLNRNPEDIVSADINEPSFITIITYQALLAAFCETETEEKETLVKEDEEYFPEETEEDDGKVKRFSEEKAKAVIENLKKHNIKILCFDEAHHLRKEWWKALNYLNEQIKPEQTIALTATPPYDADEKEWERYENLCGPIDEVISIPELVKNGDLCPHQDFIHFSLLRKEEKELVEQQINKVNLFIKDLLKNSGDFSEIIYNNASKLTEEEILEEPLIAVSMASYLKEAGKFIPENIPEILSLPIKDIPKFGTDFQKALLSYAFFQIPKKSEDETEKEIITHYYNKAKIAGAISNKSVMLCDTPKLKRQFANSLGKLDSIKKIVNLEKSALDDKLRMVILADYIKAEVMDCSALGVIPIWQTLKDFSGISLAVLTGSLIILPATLEDELNQAVQKNNMSEYVSVETFERDSNYIKVIPKGTKKSFAVNLITQMFNDGHITVMVGTQALLGEGWDAPCINSLILSSTVSSYMLSNQMRGRAIRTDKNNPDKISNIWHLATVRISNLPENIKENFVYQSSPQDYYATTLQIYDYRQLEQRFQGFEAPSVQPPFFIQNGIERILPQKFLSALNTVRTSLTENDFLEVNRNMERSAIRRLGTKAMWDEGFYDKYNKKGKSTRTGVQTERKFKTINYNGDFYAILSSHTFVFIFLLIILVSALPLLAIITIPLLTIFYIISLITPFTKFISCSSPAKIIRQIAIVTLETLYSMNKIKTNLSQISITSRENPLDKTIFVAAKNLTAEENNLLIKCIQEVLDPIENPRYILVRQSKLTTDYHAIPKIIGEKKKNVDLFESLWQKYIGKCKIIYTRNIMGRKILLNARDIAYSSMFRSGKSRRMSRYE